jgi:hypothetical protein
MCQKSKKLCLEAETPGMPEFEEALPHRTQVTQFCLACESNNNKTTSSTLPVTNQSPILKPETPKPVVVSAEYKMFRAAGASPAKAQALKDACTADKTCPKTLKIAKAVVKGEITLGLVSKPDQPCTEAEFKQEEKSGSDGDGCYYKSAEGKKAMREAQAANQAQENKPSAVESWKDAAVLAESQPNNKDLAGKAEKARLEAIVENGKSHLTFPVIFSIKRSLDILLSQTPIFS